MIRSARFQNFKALRDVSIDFEPLTFLVGPNGSGKTTILEGLLSFPKFDCHTTGIPGEQPIHEYFRKGLDQRIIVDLEFSDSFKLVYSLNDPNSKREPRRHVGDHPLHIDASHQGRSFKELQDQGVNTQEIFSRNFSMRLLQLDAVRLAKPSPTTESNAATIASNGEGLPSFLSDLYQNRPDDFKWVEESLRKAVPNFQRLRFRRVKDDLDKTRILESLLFDFKGASDVPGSMTSEGTLLVLGLLSFMVGRDRPNIFLLDDIDRALHPRAQRDLVSIIREYQKIHPETQFIATTHSPILLDFARFEEVRMTGLNDSGEVLCARMDEHPKYEKWKNEMAPGEFWSMIGENWIKNVVHEETVS